MVKTRRKERMCPFLIWKLTNESRIHQDMCLGSGRASGRYREILNKGRAFILP